MKYLLSLLAAVSLLASCSKGKDSEKSVTPVTASHKVTYIATCPSKKTEITFYNYAGRKDSTLIYSDTVFRYDFNVSGNVDLKTIGLYINVFDRDSIKYDATATILVDDTMRGESNGGRGYASAYLR